MKNLNFHKLKDEQQLRFYQMPKVLFTSDIYKGLSLGAKAMYSVLRDRQELSIKNNWVDEDEYIYLIYTVESLCDLLDISDKTVTKYKRELAKYELLFEKRMGQGKPNRLYVLKPNYEEVDLYDKNIDNTYPQGQSIGNTKTRNNYDSMNRKNSDSAIVESPTLESEKLRPNDTDFSDTDFNETINHSNKKEKERVNEKTDNLKIKLDKLLEKAEINKYTLGNNYKSVKRAIELLYYRTQPLEVNNVKIPIEQLREDLEDLTYFHIEMGLRIFDEQSANQIIHNRISYLAVCIYNSLYDIELKIQNDLRYQGII